MITIALFGAGGKMGTRAGMRLHGDLEYRVLHVEPSVAGQEKLCVARHHGGAASRGLGGGRRGDPCGSRSFDR